MAVKTMPLSTGTSLYNEGWHEVTISKAVEGVYRSAKDESKYIDLWFENYADNNNLRVYQAVNRETSEEFKLVNLFRHAMAGIISKLDDPTGKKPILQYDDDVANLVGKHINAFIYKNEGGYNTFYDTIAPVEQEGEHYSFTTDQVTALKASAEKSFYKSNKSKHLAKHITNGVVSHGTPITTGVSNEDVEIPF